MALRTRRWRVLEILPDGTRRYLPRVYLGQREALEELSQIKPEVGHTLHAVRDVRRVGATRGPGRSEPS